MITITPVCVQPNNFLSPEQSKCGFSIDDSANEQDGIRNRYFEMFIIASD